jgi:hypothetical protein
MKANTLSRTDSCLKDIPVAVYSVLQNDLQNLGLLLSFASIRG